MAEKNRMTYLKATKSKGKFVSTMANSVNMNAAGVGSLSEGKRIFSRTDSMKATTRTMPGKGGQKGTLLNPMQKAQTQTLSGSLLQPNHKAMAHIGSSKHSALPGPGAAPMSEGSRQGRAAFNFAQTGKASQPAVGRVSGSLMNSKTVAQRPHKTGSLMQPKTVSQRK